MQTSRLNAVPAGRKAVRGSVCKECPLPTCPGLPHQTCAGSSRPLARHCRQAQGDAGGRGGGAQVGLFCLILSRSAVQLTGGSAGAADVEREGLNKGRKYSYLACREEMEAALEAAGLSVRKYQRKKPAKAFVKVGLKVFVEGA